MLPSSDPQFVQALHNGLTYWQQCTDQLNDAAVQALDSQKHNLYRILQYGLVYPETWRQTVIVVLQSFNLAERRGYWDTWENLLHHLLEKCPATELLLQLQMLNRLGQLQTLSQKRAEAVATHLKAKTIAETVGDAHILAEIHHHLLQDYRNLSQLAEAEQHGQAALAYFGQQPTADKWLAGTLQLLGVVARERGILPLSQERLAQSVAIWRTLEDKTALARVLSDSANTLRQNKQHQAALTCLQESAQLLAATANEFDKTMVHINRGVLYFELEQWAEAEAAFQQANSSYLRQSGHMYYQALVATNLGNVYLKIGRLPETQSQLQHAATLWLQLKDEVSRANVLGTLAESYVLQQKIKEAAACYDEATGLLKKHPNTPWAQQLLQKFTRQRQTLDEQENVINLSTKKGG